MPDRKHLETLLRQGWDHLQNTSYHEAIKYFDLVLANIPTQPDAIYFKSVSYLNLAQPEEAIQCIDIVLQTPQQGIPSTTLANCHKVKGSACQALKLPDQAIHHFTIAIETEPNNPDRHIDLAQCYLQNKQFDQADASIQNAETLDPAQKHIRTASARGEYFFQTWQLDRYLDLLQQTIRKDPTNLDLICQYLMVLNYKSPNPDDHHLDECSVAREHIALGTPLEHFYRSKLSAPEPELTSTPRTQSNRLRVGFISPDLKQHSISYFLLPLLKGLNALPDVETFCYSTSSVSDQVTEQIKDTSDSFRQICTSNDFHLIKSDHLDILIDLAGHTNSNQLLSLIRSPKLATHYAHWMGYPNTIGFPLFDFRIVDPITDPPTGPNTETSSETKLRLNPCFLCFEPPENLPNVSTLPALHSGKITLASYNNLNKVTPEMLELWAKLLMEDPRFQLIIKSPKIEIPSVRQHLLRHFEDHHIDVSRITLVDRFASANDYYTSYDHIDICLDPFPYNGTTSTFEALLMGCPVFTLSGQCHRSRVSRSILQQLDLNDWIVDSKENYIQSCLNNINDLTALAQLRFELRDRLLTSELCNNHSFSKRFVALLRKNGVGNAEFPKFV